MVIALISCSKEKVNYKCPAWELYSASHLFSLSYQYAKKHADKIFILSAKYGLVTENQMLNPYNQTLKEMSRQQQLLWADNVIRSLQQECDIENDHFIILAGNAYYKDLIYQMPHYSLPLEGMPLGVRMSYLKKTMDGTQESICVRLHRIFCNMPRYHWDQVDQITFTNGIYIVFEKGEMYHGMERIVRVGTHTADNRLKSRLADHFVKENHDGSIFRKNIGKAILNAHNDPYLSIWTLDTSKPENRPLMDIAKNADTERRVSKYLRDNFSFTVFQVNTKAERLRMEEAIIATLNCEKDFSPSRKWAGQYSPECKIRNSGLWLKQGLDGRPMTESEYRRLQILCKQSNGTVCVNDLDTPNQVVTKTPFPNGGYGKYEPLFQFLQRQTANRIMLTMAEIEAILGCKLPNSAYTYPMWYNPNGHPHCQAWIQAGYTVEDIPTCIKTKTITFSRK